MPYGYVRYVLSAVSNVYCRLIWPFLHCTYNMLQKESGISSVHARKLIRKYLYKDLKKQPG